MHNSPAVPRLVAVDVPSEVAIADALSQECVAVPPMEIAGWLVASLHPNNFAASLGIVLVLDSWTAESNSFLQ